MADNQIDIKLTAQTGELQASIEQAVSILQSGFGTAMNAVQINLTQIGTVVAQNFEQVTQNTQVAMNTMVSHVQLGAGQVAAEMQSGMDEAAKTTEGGLGESAVKMKQGMTEIAGAVGQGLATAFPGIAGFLSKTATELNNKITVFRLGLVLLEEFAGGQMTKLSDVFNSGMNKVGDWAGKGAEKIGSAVKGAFLQLPAPLTAALSLTAQNLAGGLGNMANNVHGALSQMAPGVMGGMSKVTSGMSGVVGTMGSAMGGAIKAIPWAAIGQGAIDAAKQLYAAAEASSKFTSESEKMGKNLGMSTTKAAQYQTALKGIGVSSEDFSKGFSAFAESVRNNGDEMKKYGVEVDKVKSGQMTMEQAFMNATKEMDKYKAGADQAAYANKVFGLDVSTVTDLQDLNNAKLEEAKRKQEELGLVVGEKNVENNKKYQQAMANVDLVMQGFQKTIGDAVMPVITALAEWFAKYGPAAISILRGSIEYVTQSFQVFKAYLLVLKEIVHGFGEHIGIVMGTVANVIDHVLKFDFSGAISAWDHGFKAMQENAAERVKAIAKIVSEAKKEISEVKPAPNNPTPEPSKTYTEKDKKGKEHVHNRKSAPTDHQGSSGKGHNADKNTVPPDNKPLADKPASNTPADNIPPKPAGASAPPQQKELSKDLAKFQKEHDEAMARIQLERETDATLKELGLMSDADEQARERERLDQELSAEKKLFDEKAKLYEGDQAALAKITADKAALEKDYADKIKKIDQSIHAERMKTVKQYLQPVTQAFDNSINGMLKGTMTFKQAMGNVGKAIKDSAINAARETLKNWIQTEASKTAATIMANLTRTNSDKGAAQESVLSTAWAAGKNILAAAWEAAANVYKSVASIPYVGPFMAPAMAIGAATVIGGYVGRIASAAGGYDIPAGVNPLTQLHEKEMVLPAKHADVIRSLSEGGTGGGAQPVNVNISAVDARSVKRLFMDHGGALTDSIRAQARNFRTV
jgi:hypothetical protein